MCSPFSQASQTYAFWSPGFESGIPPPAGTCQFLLGDGIATVGWSMRGGRGKQIQKYKKYKEKKDMLSTLLYLSL